VDILGGKVAVLIHDKALLEEDDILPAALLIFGKNPGPLIKQIGRRWFLSPGLGGIMTVSDVDDELTATVFGADFSVLQSEVLSSVSELRMRVQGSAGHGVPFSAGHLTRLSADTPRRRPGSLGQVESTKSSWCPCTGTLSIRSRGSISRCVVNCVDWLSG